MEALNQAESTIYQTEKTIKDMGDKVSATEKSSRSCDCWIKRSKTKLMQQENKSEQK